MNLNPDFVTYANSTKEELLSLIRTLCKIQAPTGYEHERAMFCKHWFESNGMNNIAIDEADNVIYTISSKQSGYQNNAIVFMAHTDTVFPFLDPLPFSEDEHYIHCPGVGDDTANLAILMICAKYFTLNNYKSDYDIIFVANSCEEGLGNSAGCRQIVRTYGDRMKALITFDGGNMCRVVTKAVGSHRYKITVKTEGGHSYASFGNKNAIHELSLIINDFYDMPIPHIDTSKTTINIGTISGGTSVNTIAQEANALVEYRSDDYECLEIMKENFIKLISVHNTTDVQVECELIGERPCGGPVDPKQYNELISIADKSIRDVLGKEPIHGSSSTDCNIPLSCGIPSICIGAKTDFKSHTLEECLDKNSLVQGTTFALHFMNNFFKSDEI